MTTERDTYKPTRDDLIDPGPRWDADPAFDFENEVDALMTLETLGYGLASARRQVEEYMRYMTAAILAARQVTEDGTPVSAQAIINHSGLARQTVYNIIKPEVGK